MSLYSLFSFVYNSIPLGKAQASKTRSLHIPDLFAGILSGEPERNPHETVIRPKSEAWTKE
jgi:hypothetical protein